MRRVQSLAIPYSIRLGGPHPTRFGTGRTWLREAASEVESRWGEDLRWFASAYAIGFVAVSTFIA